MDTNRHTGALRGFNALDSLNIAVAGAVDFARSYTNKNLDNVPNGTRAAWDSVTQKSGAIKDTDGNLNLKNVAQGDATTAGPTVSNNTWIDLPEMSKTITTKGNDVLIIFSGPFDANVITTSVTVELKIQRDGVDIGPIAREKLGPNVADLHQISFSYVDPAPSAASHTYKIQWRMLGIGTARADGTFRKLQVVELG